MLIYEWTPYQSPPLHIPAGKEFFIRKKENYFSYQLK
jgi:hypothetical protein